MNTPTYPQSPSFYPEPYDQQFETDNIDIKRYIALFLSNWYWFAISLMIALSLAYAINRYSEKTYTVSSTFLIKDSKSGGGLSYAESFMAGSALFSGAQNLNNEIGIMKSFSLNKRVIDSLPEFRIVYFGVGKRNIVESRLYKRSPFKVITKSINSQPVHRRVFVRITSADSYILEIDGDNKIEREMEFGRRFNEAGFDFIIEIRDPEYYEFNPGSSNKYYFYFTGVGEIANSYRRKLSVTPINENASLVTLSSTGFVPEQEADYLNMLMKVYLNQGLEAKNQIADSTVIFIDRQLAIISDSLREAEDNLEKFRLENKIVDLSSEGTLIKSRIEQYENEKSTLELQKQYYQYLKDYLDSRNESGDIVSPSVMGVNDQTFLGLVGELADLQRNKKQLSMNLSENLPAVNLMNENINITRKTLYENIENNLVATENSIKNTDEKIRQVTRELNKLPGTERKMINIQRKFDINNTVYTYLLEKRAETGIARASTVADNKIIDQADTFNSVLVKPKRKRNNMMAFIFGMLIPGITISLLYYLNNKIIDNRDITKRTKVPIIGYISHNENKKEVPVIDNPGSALSESFRSIRTSLRYFIKETSNPVIAITSTISAEGKTFISINLAAVTALLGKKVLLIGLDLRKPRIHKILGIDNGEGMSTYLSSDCEYKDVIKETAISNLFYASSGPVPPNPAELIDDERMARFIEKAKKEFDFIFIDTPPVAVVSDTLLLTGFVDINIFVVRQRFSSKNTIELIQELYQAEKLKNMGIIINDISLSGYYGYGLRYGYYRGYGYSYGKNYYGQYSYGKYGYSDKEQDYYDS